VRSLESIMRSCDRIDREDSFEKAQMVKKATCQKRGTVCNYTFALVRTSATQGCGGGNLRGFEAAAVPLTRKLRKSGGPVARSPKKDGLGIRSSIRGFIRVGMREPDEASLYKFFCNLFLLPLLT
jgi:hypothetical protein